MSSGGKGGGGTTTAKIEPWKPAQDYIKTGMEGALDWYQGGSAGAYPGQTVAQMNPWQMAGYDWQAQRAMQGSPLTDAAQSALMGQMQGGYNPAAAIYGQMAMDPNAGANAAMPYAYQNIASAQQQNPAMGMMGLNALQSNIGLPGLAGFAQTGQGNPYLQGMYQDAAGQMTDAYQRSIVPNIDAQMSRAGRLGSQAHVGQRDIAQENLAQGLGDLATGLFGGQYQSDMNRALAAQQALAGTHGQDLARQLSAAQGIGGLHNQGLQAQLQATGQLGSLANLGFGNQLAATAGLGGQYQDDMRRQLAAIGAAPQLALQDYADIQQLIGAGGALQQQQQQELGAEQQRWMDQMYGQGSYPNWTQQYISQISPFSGMGSTTSGGGTSPLQGMLGGGMLGAGIGNMVLGDAAATAGLGGFAPYLAGGAALGGLMGLI